MENMKYIRTKNGKLYDMNEIGIDENIKEKAYIHKPTLDVIYVKSIIAQADTIEELCDGLIVEDKDNTNNWFVMDISEYQSKDNVDKKYMVDRWNFYAFIKTDKGLIYVAKMNESGVLELI